MYNFILILKNKQIENKYKKVLFLLNIFMAPIKIGIFYWIFFKKNNIDKYYLFYYNYRSYKYAIIYDN